MMNTMRVVALAAATRSAIPTRARALQSGNALGVRDLDHATQRTGYVSTDVRLM